MAEDVEPLLLGWRLYVVVLATLATVVALGLALRSSFASEERASLATARPRASPTAQPAAPTVEPGARVEVVLVPLASGDVRVVERVRTRTPLSVLTLEVPPATSSSRLSTAPRVVDLEVDAGDVRIPTVPPAADGPWTLTLPARGTELRLTYRLVGATAQRPEAPDDRALVTTRPLTYAVGSGDLTVVVEVRNVVVHNMVCPDLPVDDQLCGRQEGDGVWRTPRLPGDASTVVAQVDLPRA